MHANMLLNLLKYALKTLKYALKNPKTAISNEKKEQNIDFANNN